MRTPTDWRTPGKTPWTTDAHEDLIRKTRMARLIGEEHEIYSTGVLRGRVPHRITQTLAATCYAPMYSNVTDLTSPTISHLLLENEVLESLKLGVRHHFTRVEPFMPLVIYKNDHGNFDLHIGATLQYLNGHAMREDNLPLHFPDESYWSSRSLMLMLFAFKMNMLQPDWIITEEQFSNNLEFNEWCRGSEETLYLMEVLPFRIERVDAGVLSDNADEQPEMMLSPHLPHVEFNLNHPQWAKECPWLDEHDCDGGLVAPRGSLRDSQQDTRHFYPAWTEFYFLSSGREDVFPCDAQAGDYAFLVKTDFIPGNMTGTYDSRLSSASKTLIVTQQDILNMHDIHYKNDPFRFGVGEPVNCTIHDPHGNMIVQALRATNAFSQEDAHCRVITDSVLYRAEETSGSYSTDASDEVLEPEERNVQYIETWADNRGRILVDLCAITMEPIFFHEFIRCKTCNGEVEVRIPKSMAGGSTDCPHCGETDGITWPHCKVPTPLKE